MEYLVYISTAKSLLNEHELEEILKESSKKNKEKDITGVLLYSQGTFLQLLEGTPEALESVYSFITKDQRHKNIIKLLHAEIPSRAFNNWSMGFKATDEAKMSEVDGYFNPAKPSLILNNDHPATAIIKTFLETH